LNKVVWEQSSSSTEHSFTPTIITLVVETFMGFNTASLPMHN